MNVPIQKDDRVYRRLFCIAELHEADIAFLAMNVPIQVRDLDIDLQCASQRRHLHMVWRNHVSKKNSKCVRAGEHTSFFTHCLHERLAEVAELHRLSDLRVHEKSCVGVRIGPDLRGRQKAEVDHDRIGGCHAGVVQLVRAPITVSTTHSRAS